MKTWTKPKLVVLATAKKAVESSSLAGDRWGGCYRSKEASKTPVAACFRKSPGTQ